MPVRGGQCLVCGVSIARREGAGRPAQYCGDEHRRAAEYRLRRVQSLLARAEKKAQDAGLAVLQASPYRRAWAEQARVYWNDEVTRCGPNSTRYSPGKLASGR